MRLRSVDLAIAIIEAVHESGDWFQEPSDLDLLKIALDTGLSGWTQPLVDCSPPTLVSVSRPTVAVTGATGNVGGRVARRLAAASVAQRLLVRDSARAPHLDGAELATIPAGYEDAAQLRDALRGIDTLFLVSATESPRRWMLHTNAVDAALKAGVRRIVYLSFISAGPECTFTFGRDHWKTEAHIRSRGVAFTFLRDNIYADFVPYFAGEDGVIRGPAGAGRVAVVAQDDIADVAARILIDGGHEGATYNLTGPEALTMDEIAGRLSDATGRSVSYVDETIEEAYASRALHGAPAWQVDGWVSTYTAIARGDMDYVSDSVEVVAGHPATPLAQVLAKARNRH